MGDYARLCINACVGNALTSADSDVNRPSRYGVVETDHAVRRDVGWPAHNQFAEQIDGPASGDTSHVKGRGLLLMSQDVELRSPFARVHHGSAWKEWGRPIRELRQDDPDEAGRDSRARSRSSIHGKERSTVRSRTGLREKTRLRATGQLSSYATDGSCCRIGRNLGGDRVLPGRQSSPGRPARVSRKMPDSAAK